MDLLSNLNESTWTNGDPSNQEGYINFRIFKYLPKGEVDQYNYAMFDEDGNMYVCDIQGGQKTRDPLTGISNLSCKISEDRHHIVGIIVDDDCVEFTGTLMPKKDS